MGKTVFKRTLASALGFSMVFGQGVMSATAATTPSPTGILGSQSLNVQSLLDLPADSNESAWGEELYAMLQWVSAQEEVLDTTEYMGTVAALAGSYDYLVNEVFKNALNVTASLDASKDDALTITGDISNMNTVIGNEIQRVIDEKLAVLYADPDLQSADVDFAALQNLDFSDIAVGGEFTLTVNVADLATDKVVKANIEILLDEKDANGNVVQKNYILTDIDAFVAYVNDAADQMIEVVSAAAQEAFNSVANAVADVQAELDGYFAEAEDARVDLDDAKVKLDDAKVKLDDAQEKLDAAQTKLDNAQADHEAKSLEILSLTVGTPAYDSAVAELAGIDQRLDDAQTELDEKQALWDEKDAEWIDAMDQWIDYDAELNRITDELNDAQARLDQKVIEFNKSAGEFNKTLDDYRAKLERAINKGLNKLDEYTTKFVEESINESAASIDELVAKVTKKYTVADAADSKKVNKALGFLNNFMTERGLNTNFATADIEAALGMMYDVSLIVDDSKIVFEAKMEDENADAAIAYMEEQDDTMEISDVYKLVTVEINYTAQQASLFFDVTREYTATPVEDPITTEYTEVTVDSVNFTAAPQGMYWSEDQTPFDLTGTDLSFDVTVINHSVDEDDVDTVTSEEMTLDYATLSSYITLGADCAFDVDYTTNGLYTINMTVDFDALVAAEFADLEDDVKADLVADLAAEFDTVNASYKALIGLRGDANKDNAIDAMDASALLVHTTFIVINQDDPNMDEFACFLGNVDASEDADSMDASYLLKYSAISVLGVTPNFTDIISGQTN